MKYQILLVEGFIQLSCQVSSLSKLQLHKTENLLCTVYTSTFCIQIIRLASHGMGYYPGQHLKIMTLPTPFRSSLNFWKYRFFFFFLKACCESSAKEHKQPISLFYQCSFLHNSKWSTKHTTNCYIFKTFILSSFVI